MTGPRVDDESFSLPALERRALDILALSRPQKVLAEDVVARVRLRVLTASRRSNVVPRRSVYAIAGIGCLLGAFGGAALGARYLQVEQPSKAPASALARRAPGRPIPRPVAVLPPPVAVEVRVHEDDELEAAVPASPPPRVRRARPSVDAVPTSLARESAAIGAALRALEVDTDPAAALRHLDRYDAAFPAGELAAEARLARAQALIGSRQPRAALAFLDGLSLDGDSRGGELLVLRGELRARQGRCADAMADFQRSLVRAPEGPRAERALFGKASCRGRLGDIVGARADLETYLARFPRGRFAADAERALETAR